jgi:hypothetical protein
MNTDRRRPGAMRAIMWANAEGEDAHASKKSVERLAVTKGRKKEEGKVKEKLSEEGGNQSIKVMMMIKVYLASTISM